jgi:hypothetical protein
MKRSFGSRVWAGDRNTVAEAREKYQQDPEAELVPFGVALYSFRNNPRFARELLELREPFLARARGMLQIGADRLMSARDYANRADVLSTYLEWMSRRRELSAEHQEETLGIADTLARRGQERASELEVSDHSRALLALIRAYIAVTRRGHLGMALHLDMIAREAVTIKDPNQRARVYRKLGLLYRRCSDFSKGIGWGIRACFVPDVPLAVRLKSAAALFGIDR